MKTRNVNLNNSPLLTNNIFKHIFLEAPTEKELIKKVKEYEVLLTRVITNKYRLTNLSLDNNGKYELLPDGNYQASMILNFSGIEKGEITNPERTLQIVKHLTALESKKNDVQAIILKPLHKKVMRTHMKSIAIPIDVKSGVAIDETISTKQAQLLEQLINKVNLKKVSFSIKKTPTVIVETTYEYDEEIEKPKGQNELDNGR